MSLTAVDWKIEDTAVTQAIMPALKALEVRESDDEPTMAIFRVGLSQDPGGTIFPLDEDLLVAGKRMTLGMQVALAPMQWLFHGVITHVRPHFEQIESNCYVEIIARDHGALLDVEDRAATYPDASDADAAREIFQRYHLESEVEDTREHYRADHQLLMQTGTDWNFLQHLAHRNGFVCYFEYDGRTKLTTGHFKRRPVTGDPQPDLVILQDGVNLKWLDMQALQLGPTRWIGAAVDPIRKRVVASEGESSMDQLGPFAPADAIEVALRRFGVGTTRILPSPPPTDQAMQAAGSGLTDFARFVIEAKGEVDTALYGRLLRPRRTALLRGMGKRHSGLYYIRRVRTVLDDNQMVSQTFGAERNAEGQSGQESFGRRSQEVTVQ